MRGGSVAAAIGLDLIFEYSFGTPEINISEKEDLITPAAAWWRAEHVHAVQCQSSAHFTLTFLIVVQNANKEMIVN